MEITIVQLDGGNLLINKDFLHLFEANKIVTAKDIWGLKDQVVKAEIEERRTGRLFLDGPGGGAIEVYIKRYFPVPRSKRIKDLFSLKWRVPNAFNEWEALIEFHRNRLPTLIPMAVGRHEDCSFNLTLGLKDYRRASELLDKGSGLTSQERLHLISNIASYVAKMHRTGFAHQDLYLVHFFIKGTEFTPYLIDLQRVVMQKRLRRHWVIKDLAQLLFSARLVMTDEEIGLLLDEYSREIGFDIRDDKRLFSAIEKKASRIYARYRKKGLR